MAMLEKPSRRQLYARLLEPARCDICGEDAIVDRPISYDSTERRCLAHLTAEAEPASIRATQVSDPLILAALGY